MYDRDSGASEDWDIFYMGAPEVYLTEEARDERIENLKTACYEDGHPCNYGFIKWDVDVRDVADHSHRHEY